MKKSIATLIAAAALITLPTLASAAPGQRGHTMGRGQRGHNSAPRYGGPARQAPRYGAPARRAPRYTAPARQAPRYAAPARRFGPRHRGYVAPRRAPHYRVAPPVYRPAPVVAGIDLAQFCYYNPAHPICAQYGYVW